MNTDGVKVPFVVAVVPLLAVAVLKPQYYWLVCWPTVQLSLPFPLLTVFRCSS